MDGWCCCARNHRRSVSKAEKSCNHPVHQANQHQLLWLPGRLGLVNLAAARSGEQAGRLPPCHPSPPSPKSQNSQVPSPKSQVVTRSLQLQPDLSACGGGGRTDDKTRDDDRGSRVSTSHIDFPQKLCPRITHPAARCCCCAVLTCRGCPCPAQACAPVGAAHWVCVRLDRHALLHPAARCTAAPCGPCLLVGLVAFTAGVPPGCCAVDPSVMHWPDSPIDGVICARHVGGPSEVTLFERIWGLLSGWLQIIFGSWVGLRWPWPWPWPWWL